MKPNSDNDVEILHQDIKKHFDTVAKYISDEAFVFMAASRSI